MVGTKLIRKNRYGLFINEGGKYCTISIFMEDLKGIRIWLFELELCLLYHARRRND